MVPPNIFALSITVSKLCAPLLYDIIIIHSNAYHKKLLLIFLLLLL